MCKCTPNIRTPYCGKLGCQWPKPVKPGAPIPREFICPDCLVERADYEGPGQHLEMCPNCLSDRDPVDGGWSLQPV